MMSTSQSAIFRAQPITGDLGPSFSIAQQFCLNLIFQATQICPSAQARFQGARKG
jgi:hypothetical protein